MKKLFLLLLLFTNICLGQSFSSIYDFVGITMGTVNPDPTPVPVSNGLTFGSFNATNNLTPTIGTIGRFNFSNWDTGATNTLNTFTGVINTNKYYQVTISPQPGYNIDINTISFTIQRSATGIRQYSVRSSLDNYTTNLPASISTTNINLSVVSTNIFQISDTTTSLNNGSLITLGSNYNILTSPITFRFYSWNSEATTGTFSIDNVRFNGVATTCSGGSTIWTSTWSNGVPTSNSSVIIDGNYNTSNPSPQGSFDACSVTVNSGKTLTINSNQYIKIQNELVVNGTGNVIVEDGGSIVQVNDNVNVINTGNITYKRKTTPVTRFDYTYWSTPVSPQTLLALSPNTLSDKFYRWDFSISIPNWVNVAPNSNMLIGTGYIIRAPQPFDITTPQIYEAIFSGVPNNRVYNVAIGSEYTLIGNPYPSAISADMLITNDPNLSGTLYFWTHNTPITNYNYTGDDYATYTLVGGVGTTAINTGINNNTPNGKIAAGQGFFFKNTSTSTNIIFNNSLRLTNNNNQFFRTSQEKDRFWLEMTNDNGLYKQILIGYVNGATNNIDGNYDGEILEAGNIISLYTIVDDKLLTIQGRQYPFNIDDSINLGYKTNISGDFKIKLSDVNGLFTTQNIYLQDLYSNTIHDLKQSPYTFNSVSGTFNDRFILRYTNNSLGNNDFIINNTIIYNKDNKINIDSNKIIKNVKVYDITGKLLYDNNFNSNNVKISLECSKQILFVKIKTEDDQVITRKILND